MGLRKSTVIGLAALAIGALVAVDAAEARGRAPGGGGGGRSISRSRASKDDKKKKEALRRREADMQLARRAEDAAADRENRS